MIPEIIFNPENRRVIKRIALIEIPEPYQYDMHSGRKAGKFGSGLGSFMGAAMGPDVLANTSKSQDDPSAKFTKAMLPYKPEISSTLLDKLETGLIQKGYGVVRIAQPPMAADGKSYDLTKIEGSYDAILSGSISGGYSSEQHGISPIVIASFSLLASSNAKTVFKGSYIYCADGVEVDQDIQIVSDSKYILGSVDDLYANMSLALEGLTMGASKLAEQILVDF